MTKSNHAENRAIKDYLIEKAVDVKQHNYNIINKRLATTAALNLIASQDFADAIKATFKKGWCTPVKYCGKRSHKKAKRVENIVLSDLHFQSLIDPEECPIGYGAIEESRRLGKVAEQVADYKRQYRKDTKLVIHLLGDIIQGTLHDARDGAPLAWQQAAAIHYIVQFIMFQSAQFPSVEVYCASGNHGRNKQRHHDRAVHQKWDSHETTIYYAVKTAILNAGIKNVKFVIPKTPYYVVDVFGKKIFGTHGCTVFKSGYPGHSINVKALSHQLLKWNEAKHVGGPFDLVVVGHIHVPAQVRLPEGSIITNGALVPSDPFAVSIGSPSNVCGQWLFESTKDHVVGDSRFIVVDGAENDASYNKIITPFTGL
jgi:predicted phosphodiesterase